MSPTKVRSVTLPDGRIVPVVFVKPEEESSDTKKLRKIAAEAGAEAASNAHLHGHPIAIVQDDKIVRIAPDGTKTVLGTV